MPTAVTTNALIGKKKPPAEAELKTALGPASQVWQQFLGELAHREQGDTATLRAWSFNSSLTAAKQIFLSESRSLPQDQLENSI